MTDVVQSAFTETKTSPTIRGIKTKTEESFRKETLLQNSAYDLCLFFMFLKYMHLIGCI